MDKSSKGSPEQSKSHAPESQKRQEQSSKLPKQPFETTSSKTAEYIELGESAEVSGEVSEVLREQSEQKATGMFGKKKKKSAKPMTAAQIKAQLLKNAPSQQVMINQVKREIEKEVKYLNKRARKILRKPGAVNAFELNNVVKKIRDLRTLLLTLMKATADAAKTLWLRFVHGVM